MRVRPLPHPGLLEIRDDGRAVAVVLVLDPDRDGADLARMLDHHGRDDDDGRKFAELLGDLDRRRAMGIALDDDDDEAT